MKIPKHGTSALRERVKWRKMSERLTHHYCSVLGPVLVYAQGLGSCFGGICPGCHCYITLKRPA